MKTKSTEAGIVVDGVEAAVGKVASSKGASRTNVVTQVGSANEPWVLTRISTLDRWVAIHLHGDPIFGPMPADHMGPHAARPDPATHPLGEFWQSLDQAGRPLYMVVNDDAADRAWRSVAEHQNNPPLGPVAGQTHRAWLAGVVAFLRDEKQILVPDALRADAARLRSDHEATPARPKQRRGFAAMSAEKQQAIASLGGKASHAKGTGHEWTKAEAAEAGRKGGTVSRGGRGRAVPE